MPLPHACFQEGSDYREPVSKIVCVGRNYAAHARELDNPVPTQPLLFIKPPSTLQDLHEHIDLPADRGPVHYETEVALLIGSQLCRASQDSAMDAVIGVGLALDLTLRERQSELKENGYPWEIAKAFDGACPLSRFVAPETLPMPDRFRFTLSIDGEERQHGDTAEMLKPMPALLAYMSQHFTLWPGDVVLTGTPAGVGVLEPGQSLELALESQLRIESRVR